mmetsp:Transcript_29264/g.52632  ORF Transcript_29264/g.52632 Transcript_29264/m.52632 type:complete len:145 (-) Transcript_29264:812-1246(-)
MHAAIDDPHDALRRRDMPSLAHLGHGIATPNTNAKWQISISPADTQPHGGGCLQAVHTQCRNPLASPQGQSQVLGRRCNHRVALSPAGAAAAAPVGGAGKGPRVTLAQAVGPPPPILSSTAHDQAPGPARWACMHAPRYPTPLG